jgi:NAD(P)H-hydrate epimerase
MKILTAAQMQEVDRLTTDTKGVPSLILMENAGISLYLALRDCFGDLQTKEIAIVCGKGNNGGDGLVLARQLLQRGIFPDVFLLANHDEVTGDAGVNLGCLLKRGHPVMEISEEGIWEEVSRTLAIYDIVVDAILGTGICKPLQGLYSKVVSDINQTDCFVLSVDIPSGMLSDSLEPAPETIWANATVTFTAPKIAHILNQDVEAIGNLTVAPIGTPPELLETPEYPVNLLTRGEMARQLRPRLSHSHKGTYGHVALIAGSQGKAGAAALASYAALRAGSGLVTAFSPGTVQDRVASHHAEVMTEGFPATGVGTFSEEAIERVLRLLGDKEAAGLGPGLTTEAETVRFVRGVVQQSPVPLVVDADGLNAFEGKVGLLRNGNGCPLVLTPHPGEFSRLIEMTVPEILKDQIGVSRKFATEHSVWLVLKTSRSLIAAPDGQIFVSPLGNPGMATAGMGDVLTGILVSMLGQYAAQGLKRAEDVTAAMCLGLFIHGTAGDLAAGESGRAALVAGDVTDYLVDAFESLMEVQ